MSNAPTEKAPTATESASVSEAQSMMVAASPGSASGRPADHQLGVLGALIDNQAWNRLVKIAETFSRSDLVPKHFQGKMANCIIALQCAIRMQVDPFMLMQNMYIVHGKPGIEAKFAIAMANAKRVFRGPIRYVLSGDGMKRQCTAVAIDRETGERLEETVTMEMARREGWLDKDGSKWKSIPDLMLKYRSAMWLIRTTCPEVLMGMQTTDELLDVVPEPIDSEARVVEPRSPSDQLADLLESQPVVTGEPQIPQAEAAEAHERASSDGRSSEKVESRAGSEPKPQAEPSDTAERAKSSAGRLI